MLLAALARLQNPVVSDNCPDPAAFHFEGPTQRLVYVVSTTANHVADKFPLRRTADMTTWEPAGHVFPDGAWPRWATRDFWAPEIHKVGDGFVLYYTARSTDGLLCIGVATAPHVEGPWSDLGRPLLRDPEVGLIDAHLFQDRDGRMYLYWKEDGNGSVPMRPSVLCAQEIAADGVTLVGERTVLMTNDRPWEGDVVEGPWVVHRGDQYYLFYAGNNFNSDRYATGVARGPSALGPFTKLPEPILRSNHRWHGPGHGSVFTVAGSDFFAYHAWEAGRIDDEWDVSVHPRMMLVDRIEWREDGWPRIHDGTPSGAHPLDEATIAPQVVDDVPVG